MRRNSTSSIYSKGVRFVGAIIKRDRLYSVNHTVDNYRKAARKLNEAAKAGNIEAINHAIQSVNSYLGIFSHYNEYGMKRKIIKEELDKESWQYFTVKGHFQSIHLRKKFSVDIKYKNMAKEIVNRKISNRVPSENEISKILDRGYELEIYQAPGSQVCVDIMSA